MIANVIKNSSDEQIVVFPDVSWGFYQAVLREYPSRSRVTFDGTNLEMMTISHQHDHVSRFAHLVIVEIAFATGTPLHTGGSNTLQRSDLRKGLEPDDCYWIQHAEEIRGKTRVHLDELPAPDLVIEIDVTHTSVNRAEILAAMGVPEMWVWKLGRFSAFKLVDGVWTPTEYSVAFPMLKVNDISVFFQKLWDFRELEVLSEVRKWSSTLEKARGA